MSNVNIGPRKPVSSRYFTLSQDVPNPHYDKRCKYGVRGVAAFKAGTTIRATDYEQEVTTNGSTVLHKDVEYTFADGRILAHNVPQDVHDVFAKLDTHEDRGPSTLREAAAECGVSVETLCRYTVKSLIAAGKLTIDDVIEAYETSEFDG